MRGRERGREGRREGGKEGGREGGRGREGGERERGRGEGEREGGRERERRRGKRGREGEGEKEVKTTMYSAGTVNRKTSEVDRKIQIQMIFIDIITRFIHNLINTWVSDRGKWKVACMLARGRGKKSYCAYSEPEV